MERNINLETPIGSKGASRMLLEETKTEIGLLELSGNDYDDIGSIPPPPPQCTHAL